ncbi:sirohydrochlorin chelatase [Paenibacillus massiliensis]|uniref:sirohydrochlorin chelatase n=1 Tax=Paenibacillus massiliensis TaxID=225917 RepID=UPI00046E675B|nr:CbiX/SirB N-terminal domain-containing protein [Paenibacillus massiliensis]
MSRPGILIIGHGSMTASWVAQVDEVAGRLQLPAGVPAVVAFLEQVEGRSIQDGIDRLEEQGVTDMLVVPFFVSSGSTHVDEIGYALGTKAEPEKETDLEPFRIQARVYWGNPIDAGPAVAEIVWSKARPLSVDPEREVILLVGHGSVHDGFRQRWESGMASLMADVAAQSGIQTDFALLNPLSVRDRIVYWTEERGMAVIVAPLFLSSGYFTDVVIPRKMEGLNYRYNGEALLPHPLLTAWLQEQVDALFLRYEQDRDRTDEVRG